MKSNYLLSSITCCLFLFVSFTSIAQKENVHFEINEKTTMSDLAQIKSSMLDLGAYFQMKHLAFDEDGYIEAINISVNFNDGYQGEARMSNFKQGKVLHIIRNYDKEGDNAFCIGSCE
jgi:hypothetical protein